MVKFTTGLNTGLQRTIKAYTNGSPSNFTLISPFPNVPTIGDSFTIYAGCDKSMATCTARFSNLVNFRGTPFVPAADIVS